MPELPEVETVRQQLTDKVIGKTIAKVQVYHPKTVGDSEKIQLALMGKSICKIDRIGKLLIFSFASDDDLFLLAHLKMTGQFFYTDANKLVLGGGHSMTPADVTELPGRHTRVSYVFQDNTCLHFNDMRLFGYTKIATYDQVQQARLRFGPEPISLDFDVEQYAQRLRKRKVIVKCALLDQSFIAGLGNIYVDEALFRAKVKPTRRANRLTKEEARAIFFASRDVLNESIEVGGTTFQHFADTAGHRGNFTSHLQVFAKQNTPCPRHDGGVIKKIRAAGRGTHYCPVCQK